ncbi:MAG: hypothetical protein DMG40_06595 [Acidobacteria bacterium]|nr:MAG: hypothetical protein DMG40_06595 [Acidobacteriota bacterium]
MSYRLDHAPAVAIPGFSGKTLEVGGLGRKKMRARLSLRYHEFHELRSFLAEQKLRFKISKKTQPYKNPEASSGLLRMQIPLVVRYKFESSSQKIASTIRESKNFPKKYRDECCIRECFIGN